MRRSLIRQTPYRQELLLDLLVELRRVLADDLLGVSRRRRHIVASFGEV
jgi:hypothetical protein